jgi:Flp pilus assembly pilin Flp
MFRRVGSEERGQGLVEYALIIALVSLAAVVSPGFLSGKINDLFSKAGNSLNGVQVASGGGTGGPPPAAPPPSGGAVGTTPGGFTIYYFGPGVVNGIIGPDGVEGMYALFTVSSPTSFNINGWTFTCSWHLGTWQADTDDAGSGPETFISMCNAPAAPANTEVPVISGTPQIGQTLTTTSGAWTNSPTSYDYQWQYSNADSSNCATYGGSWTNSSTAGNDNTWANLPGTGGILEGRCVRVQVRASNVSGNWVGAESGWVTSPAVGPVAP